MKDKDVIAKEYDKSINNDSIIDFLIKIKTYYRETKKITDKIYIILDQAGYHKGEKIEKFIKNNPDIRLIYLPTYSPNLNPIERLWKVMNEKVRNNQYFSSKKRISTENSQFF